MLQVKRDTHEKNINFVDLRFDKSKKNYPVISLEDPTSSG